MQVTQQRQQAIVKQLMPQPPTPPPGAPQGASGMPGAPMGANSAPNPAMQQQALQAATQEAQKIAPAPEFDPDSLQELQEIVAAVCWEDIRKVLRSNVRRLFSIDVETDDTNFEGDEDAKGAANEFMTAFSRVLQEVLPAVQMNPVMLPLAREMVSFTANAYKVGKSFETAIDEVFDKMAKMPPKQPPAAKGAALDQAKAQQVAADTQSRLRTDAMEAQQAQQEHAATMAERVQNMKQDAEIHQSEMQARMEEIAANHQKLTLQLQEMQAKLAAAGLPAQPLAAAA
jgi:hypothetical protein